MKNITLSNIGFISILVAFITMNDASAENIFLISSFSWLIVGLVACYRLRTLEDKQ